MSGSQLTAEEAHRHLADVAGGRSHDHGMACDGCAEALRLHGLYLDSQGVVRKSARVR